FFTAQTNPDQCVPLRLSSLLHLHLNRFLVKTSPTFPFRVRCGDMGINSTIRQGYTRVGRSHTAWILTIEEDLSRSTSGVKSIITSGLSCSEAIFRQQFLRRSPE